MAPSHKRRRTMVTNEVELTLLGAWLLNAFPKRFRESENFDKNLCNVIAEFTTDRADDILAPKSVIEFAEKLFDGRCVCKEKSDCTKPEHLELHTSKRKRSFKLTLRSCTRQFTYTAGPKCTYGYPEKTIPEGDIFYSSRLFYDNRDVAKYDRPLSLSDAVEILDNLESHLRYNRCIGVQPYWSKSAMPPEMDYPGIVANKIAGWTRTGVYCMNKSLPGQLCVACKTAKRLEAHGLTYHIAV
jgi:hypothetical protein